MIRGLWDQQDEAIIDVKLDDADADSYKYDPMAELLAWWETINKYKQGKNCNYQWKHFYPFVISADVMIGREALFVLELSITMAAKMDKTIL